MEAAVSLMGLLEGFDDPRAGRCQRHPLPAMPSFGDTLVW
jgi:hypothetical protein